MTLTWTPPVAVLVALCLSALATPLVRRLAQRIGAVDHVRPEKIHARQIPRLGGIAIALGFYVPVLALGLRVNVYQAAIFSEPRRIGALLVGGLAILGLGIWDDLHGARAWQKLLIQVPVAFLTWWSGVRIGGTLGTSGFVTFAPAFSALATCVWIVVVMNAVNLLDGLDGLASGISLEILLAGALCAWLRDEPVLVLVCLCLAGAVGGFLFHNFAPATIFMGDSGSLFIGYVLASAAVWSSQKAATVVGVLLPGVALGLPILDTALAIARRLASGRSILRGDLDHVHHRLLRRGATPRGAVLRLYGVGFVFTLLSVATVIWPDPWLGRALLLSACLLAVAVSTWLGYHRPDES